jgi:hypothetical protein
MESQQNGARHDFVQPEANLILMFVGVALRAHIDFAGEAGPVSR